MGKRRPLEGISRGRHLFFGYGKESFSKIENHPLP